MRLLINKIKRICSKCLVRAALLKCQQIESKPAIMLFKKSNDQNEKKEYTLEKRKQIKYHELANRATQIMVTSGLICLKAKSSAY